MGCSATLQPHANGRTSRSAATLLRQFKIEPCWSLGGTHELRARERGHALAAIDLYRVGQDRWLPGTLGSPLRISLWLQWIHSHQYGTTDEHCRGPDGEGC